MKRTLQYLISQKLFKLAFFEKFSLMANRIKSIYQVTMNLHILLDGLTSTYTGIEQITPGKNTQLKFKHINLPFDTFPIKSAFLNLKLMAQSFGQSCLNIAHIGSGIKEKLCAVNATDEYKVDVRRLFRRSIQWSKLNDDPLEPLTLDVDDTSSNKSVISAVSLVLNYNSNVGKCTFFIDGMKYKMNSLLFTNAFQDSHNYVSSMELPRTRIFISYHRCIF